MPLLTVTHFTTYRYAVPVSFGEHRLMFRPRDSHDLRLTDTALTISPKASVRWLHDVFGNSIAIASFAEPASKLRFESSFVAEHFPLASREIVLEDYARDYPFAYSAEDVVDLGRALGKQYPDPNHTIDVWARSFLSAGSHSDSLEILIGMAHGIKRDFQYISRDELGTQIPAETLALKSGSCRDFALLMMEGARALGFAARFVSGYLYDEALIAAEASMVGGGATHAWAQIFLPGAGWVEFDPTNALIGGRNLIRVAVVRDPSQAIPLAGSFSGPPDASLGMSVEIAVQIGAP
jgi:transglutaminase-like putative cysteine protease